MSAVSGNRKTRRLAIFGLDGADFNLLRPWLEEGRLPCLARLYQQGAHGPLASTIPPLSPEAWSSFATGKNPGKHGVVNFVQPKPGSYDLLFSNGSLRRGQTFWQILSEVGRRVGVVNVPMTYPPQAVNGFFISGSDAPGMQADFTYPRELKDEMLSACGRYDVHGDFWGRTTPGEYLKRLITTVEEQGRAWKYLLERFAPEVFIGVFGSTDRAQHFLWKYAQPGCPPPREWKEAGITDPLLAVYEAVDRALEECLAALGEDSVTLVMSDHGGGPCEKVVYLDRWLQARGLLAYRDPKESWSKTAVRSLYRLGRKHLPRVAKDWIKTQWREVRQQIEGTVLREPIDWERTQAFFLGTESAYIYLNLRGRFPQGIVEPGPEAEALCARIITELPQLRDPETGEPVVEAIHRKDEIYWGAPEEVALLPDLVVTWKEGKYLVRRAWGEALAKPGVMVERGIGVGDAARLMSLELSGSHRPDGMLIISGLGLPAGSEIRAARIMDIAPSVLHIMGIRPPADMDGLVLPCLAAVGGAEEVELPLLPDGSPEPLAGDPYSEQEKEEIERRLRGLGYLE